MAFTNPRQVFSIHAIVPIRRSTDEPFGIIRVALGGEISLDGELIDSFGGSNRFPFASELADIESEFTFSTEEYPDFMFEIFLGATITETAAEASGFASALANVFGTSVSDGTTGIDSIQVDTPADLKFGHYVAKATGATTVKILGHSNIDATKGTPLAFIDDDMKFTDADLTVPGTAGTVAVPSLGISLVGGSGSIAFVTGDTASFDIRPIHTGRSRIVVGALGTSFSEFAARMAGAKRNTGEIFELHAPRAIGSGMPIGFTRSEFAAPELTMKLLQDSAKNFVFEIEAIIGEV